MLSICVMRALKRCLKYDSTGNFHHHNNNNNNNNNKSHPWGVVMGDGHYNVRDCGEQK